MKQAAPHRREHSHAFGQDLKRPGEARTQIVIAITAAMMVVEIVAGIVYGSMALLADGLHMASHVAVLSINAFVYVYARRHAHDPSFSFGTGKINTLGGYTGAVLLAGFALVMAIESIGRFIEPVAIAFNQAIFVAVLGLIVNGASVFILGHGHDHDHSHAPESGHHHDGKHHHDHNLASAYLHVLADALTSLLAIFALLAAKYFGQVWADPAMGIVGAILVARWSLGLLYSSGAVLLDRQASAELCGKVQQSIEIDAHTRVVDLHVWTVGPGIYSAIIAIVSDEPKSADHYKDRIGDELGIVHIAVEVHTAD